MIDKGRPEKRNNGFQSENGKGGLPSDGSGSEQKKRQGGNEGQKQECSERLNKRAIRLTTKTTTSSEERVLNPSPDQLVISLFPFWDIPFTLLFPHHWISLWWRSQSCGLIRPPTLFEAPLLEAPCTVSSAISDPTFHFPKASLFDPVTLATTNAQPSL